MRPMVITGMVMMKMRAKVSSEEEEEDFDHA